MVLRIRKLLPAIVMTAVASAPPVVAAVDQASVDEPPITQRDREHWAYRPLSDPVPPQVRDESSVRNAIDRFIHARLDAANLKPLPQADRLTLIRRVTFDLTGLPPTPQQVAAFVNDDSPNAYEDLVDRLLSSKAYGERWAQHWLDLARFAETDGFEHDKVRPDAWRYRDWVIRALNDDVPFDQFVRLQIAGDELAPGDRDAAIATGFLLSGPDMPDINLQEERRHTVLNEMTSTVGEVFMAMQMNCASCHDHKYDPISQADFYRLRAFFANTAFPEKNKSLGHMVREPGAEPPASHMMIRGDFRRPGPELEPAFPRVVNLDNQAVEPPVTPAKSSGRRAALAAWLTQPDHPLFGRVIVNRIWQHHMGRPLVGTPNDFGRMGDEPTHPDLLDWLAREFPRMDFSLKRLHRIIVTSATYRRASRAEDVNDARWRQLVDADPSNELLGRMNRKRLEGEAIRDAMLAAAGVLSPASGGPGVMPPLPTELVKTLRKDHWKVSEDEDDHYRRSVYLFARRNLRYPIFEVFDRPDGNAPCAMRQQSTTAPQALTLLNSELSQSIAQQLAGYVYEHAGDDTRARVTLCYQRTLSRPPTDRELALAESFITKQVAAMKAAGRSIDSLSLPQPPPADADLHTAAAITDLCLALFNLNEFVYVD